MDKKTLLRDLIQDYEKSHQKSKSLFEKNAEFQIRGGSHNLRLFAPFPFYDIRCSGSKVTDADGNTYIDFWQGHFANILGHNPKIVLDALISCFQKGQGMTTGFPGDYQGELAELILKRINAEKIRFTTSGTLATMYAIMMARAFTKKDLVLKAGGGWHGAQPFALKGITVYDHGLNQVESAGLPSNMDSLISVTRFNEIDDLEERFREYGDRIACFILEPFIGAGGFIFASKEYIQRARELTLSHSSLLIFDEVVSGFRFHAAGVQNLYGVKPDLSVFGKAIGGGMPVSAVLGRADVVALCGPEAKPEEKVRFDGGTFSAHPASMLAGLTYLKYLAEHEEEIYPRMGRLADKIRRGIEEIFKTYGFNVKCTGYGDAITENSSCIGVQFLKEEIDRIRSPEQVWNPDVCDLELREQVFKLAMLKEGFNVFHGYGAISAAHTDEEIQASLDAVERIAREWNNYNKNS